MKKTVRKPKSAPVEKKVEVATSYSLTQMYYELDTIKMQMDMFSDSELYEYCFDHIQMYDHAEMDRLYNKISVGAKLALPERKALEAFCILANTELCISV